LLTYVGLYTYTDVLSKSCLDNLGASTAGRKPSAGHQSEHAMLQEELKDLRNKLDSQIVRLFVLYLVFAHAIDCNNSFLFV